MFVGSQPDGAASHLRVTTNAAWAATGEFVEVCGGA